MRTDIDRATTVTEGMRLNDILYRQMRDELSGYIDTILEECPERLEELFDELYFYRRVIAVLESHDLPIKCLIGYSGLPRRLRRLTDERKNFLGDDESDEELYRYVLDYGYRLYDELTGQGEVKPCG